jgi:DNA-binding Lrp family transcriptional regulator
MKNHRPAELDALDRRILDRYRRDTRRTAESIGKEVGLSTAAVHRRLQRLRASGVIEAEIARVNPQALGWPLTCIVAVDIDRESHAEVERFAARMQRCANVQQCAYVTGEADFILVVAVADMTAYEAFTREYLTSDPNVRSFTTYVVMKRVKIDA